MDRVGVTGVELESVEIRVPLPGRVQTQRETQAETADREEQRRPPRRHREGTNHPPTALMPGKLRLAVRIDPAAFY